MKKSIQVLALSTVAALSLVPTLAAAQGESPTTLVCKDFVVMDMPGMMMAVTEMQKASEASNVVLDDNLARERVATTLDGCNGNPNKLAMDAMMSK